MLPSPAFQKAPAAPCASRGPSSFLSLPSALLPQSEPLATHLPPLAPRSLTSISRAGVSVR